jgi:hypothetical protein
MIEITVAFTNAEAEAVLRSEGLHNGWGVRKAKALQQAEAKLMDKLESAWNAHL